jgi:hypothetical protein
LICPSPYTLLSFFLFATLYCKKGASLSHRSSPEVNLWRNRGTTLILWGANNYILIFQGLLSCLWPRQSSYLSYWLFQVFSTLLPLYYLLFILLAKKMGKKIHTRRRMVLTH